MYFKNYFTLSSLLNKCYILRQKRNLFFCFQKHNQNIEEKKIYTLTLDGKEKMKTKFLNNISLKLEKELRRRKFPLILIFSILAISIDIKYATCDESVFTKKNLNNNSISNSNFDISNIELNFEELDEMDSFYFLKHKNKMHMIQYSANTPIEDRCFLYNININSKDLDKKKFAPKGNESEKEFVNSFESTLTYDEGERSPEQKTEICEDSVMSKSFGSERTYNAEEGSHKIENEDSLMNDISDKDPKSLNVSDNLNNDFIFAGVIDGHGGAAIAEITRRSLGHYVKKQLIEKIKRRKKENIDENDIILSLEEAYLNLDRDILKIVREYFYKGYTKFSRIGACCLSLLIDKDNYYISNAGDSRGLLIRKNGYVILNNIHNANQVSERKKLLENHPNEKDVVLCRKIKKKKRRFHLFNLTDKINKLLLDDYDNCYVKGRLQPTRNLGDFHLKLKEFSYDHVDGKCIISKPHSFPYITALPEVQKIKKSETDEFIILMTDGVTDFLSDMEIVRIVKENNTSVEKASKEIVKSVLIKAANYDNLSMEEFLKILPERKRKHYDDMSLVIIKLNED
ncbi:protein phosphatase PPM8, putative [Plasmodium gallinaceum]|uniref:Protein phosphatase PPM8, putative n=1 Tax=Plasmodium gallinaceum TaxID=5849 RepID=A0A1J1GZF4_PLAGA|nr:protein phosphatase PPM8, putative [Plasmodium gallinaceum]CRG96403.1 protein phosphatase PPM8, putative [Plasmodium gallinaceum]